MRVRNDPYNRAICIAGVNFLYTEKAPHIN